MAHTASMAARLCSPTHLDSSLFSPSSSSSSSSSPPPFRPPLLSIRAHSSSLPSSNESPSTNRRALIAFFTASASIGLFVKHARGEASLIKVDGPPPPFGGLPGTENADQARDTDLPLKDRFYLQPLSAAEAVARAKESAKDIVGVKTLIDKKAWPFVQNDLRLKASYLRYDLNTIISSKTQDEKKALRSLSTKLFDNISNLDYAARSKSVPKAEKYYGETVSTLNDVLAKLV